MTYRTLLNGHKKRLVGILQRFARFGPLAKRQGYKQPLVWHDLILDMRNLNLQPREFFLHVYNHGDKKGRW